MPAIPWTTKPTVNPPRWKAPHLEELIEQIDLVTNTLSPGWTAYTPSWTAIGTAPSLGNGTIVGAYRDAGDLVIVRVAFTAGSTSTYGTQQWLFSVPSAVAASANAILQTAGAMYILDSGSQVRSGNCHFNTSTTLFLDTSAGSVTATVPQTWATNDQCLITIAYEPA